MLDPEDPPHTSVWNELRRIEWEGLRCPPPFYANVELQLSRYVWLAKPHFLIYSMTTTPWVDVRERRLLRQRRRNELALIAELCLEHAILPDWGRQSTIINNLRDAYSEAVRDNRRMIRALEDLRTYTRRVELDNDRLHDEMDRLLELTSVQIPLTSLTNAVAPRVPAPGIEEVSDSDSDIIDLTTPYISSILPLPLSGSCFHGKITGSHHSKYDSTYTSTVVC